MDTTEGYRRALAGAINKSYSPEESERYDQLVMEYGVDNVWDSDNISEHFSINGFMAPFVVAVRKSDGVKGSMQFTHSPRFYFGFVEA